MVITPVFVHERSFGVYQSELIPVCGGEMVEGAISLNTSRHFKILAHSVTNMDQVQGGRVQKGLKTVIAK